MSIDLSQLSSATTKIGAVNAVLVTPQSNAGYQPQNGPAASQSNDPRPPAILFHYEGENSVALTSDITDHYIENNTSIQDQIALHPESVTVHGFIGELNDVVPDVLRPLKLAADRLTVVGGYFPSFSATALIAYNNAVQLYSLAVNTKNSAVAAWNSITGQSTKNQTKQQIAFLQFYQYWQNRALFTVQTPWNVFTDMAIQSLRAVQDADTRMITDFEVTFKAMRFAQSVVTSSVNASNFSGRAAAQAAGVINNGTTKGTPAAQSFSSALTGIA